MSYALRSHNLIAGALRRPGMAHAALRPLTRTQHSAAGKDSPLNPDNQPSKAGKQPVYGPIGVAAALKHSSNGMSIRHFFHVQAITCLVDPAPSSTLFKHEFSLADRVALVSGANRGLGLEMALALIEAGARAVYCVDLPKEPSEEWQKVHDYAARSTNKGGEGRLEYISGDVTDQVRFFAYENATRSIDAHFCAGFNVEDWARHRGQRGTHGRMHRCCGYHELYHRLPGVP